MTLTILHISTRLIQGGSQENTVLSCEGQAELGHDVHLAYGPIFGPEGSYFDRANDYVASNGNTITMHEVPNMVREISPMKDAKGYLELKKLIEELKPDVVHILADGRIVKTGGPELALEVENNGYAGILAEVS